MTTKTKRNYEVMSSTVGPNYPRGTILPANVDGLEIPRLLELGALRETDQEPNWPGPHTQTLNEAIHSESPPTLPNAPSVNASMGEIKAKIGPAAPPDAAVSTAQTATPRPPTRD